MEVNLWQNKTEILLAPELLIKKSKTSTLSKVVNFQKEAKVNDSNKLPLNNVPRYNKNYERKEEHQWDKMWDYYPKQVQNVLKKRKLIGERLK